MHATPHGHRATEKKEPTPEPAATPPPRRAPRHWTLYQQLAHARTLAEHSIKPDTETAYVERMLQDWTKYEEKVLEGHTGPPGTTSSTTWDNVVPHGDIGALATTVCTTSQDCSRPDHPFGDNNDPAITNAILAYHSWSTHQSIHLHTPHNDPRQWHPVGPLAMEFYLHEDATTGATQHHQPTADSATTDTGHTHTPQPQSPKRARNRNTGPRDKGTAHQPTKGPNPPTRSLPSNNSTSPSPRVTSQTTTNYPEGQKAQKARQ